MTVDLWINKGLMCCLLLDIAKRIIRIRNKLYGATRLPGWKFDEPPYLEWLVTNG